jgi:hypothetical protein
MSQKGGPRSEPAHIRFWRYVNKDGPVPKTRADLGPCWLWTGHIMPNGYGLFSDDGRRKIGAHVWAYTHVVGPIARPLEPDHLCRVRGCVNPAHLEVVTRRENQLRGQTFAARNAAKTHCINGHPFDAANTYRRTGSNRRECRKCRCAAVQRIKVKARAQA